MATIKTGWLKDNSGDKFAPKTLSSQVVTSEGITLENKIQEQLDEIDAIIANGGVDPNHTHIVENITDINDYYYDKVYIDENLATKEDIEHDHDEVYAKIGDSYTKDEMDSNFALKSELEHNHDLVYAKIGDSYTKAEEDAFLVKKLDVDTYTAEIAALEGKIATDIETHNTATEAHADIRTEVAAKVAKADIVANLETSEDTKVLAASQGAALKTELDELTTGLKDGTVVVNTATKLDLDSDVGGLTQPVYFSGGQPVATTYALDLAGTKFGLVKSGGDVTIKDGVITVNDDSHSHITADIDGLDETLASINKDISDHKNNKNNPHNVTLEQLGVTATATELNTLDGITATTTELNVLDGITASTTELNYVDGVTSSIQDQIDSKASQESFNTHTNNTTSHITANERNAWNAKQSAITGAATTITSSDLSTNKVLVSDSSGKVAASSSITTTELGYLNNVSSNIQTQLDAKQATITGAATTITGSDLTANRALISNGSGKVAVSAVTSTELGYLSGATSNIQTQLDNKASSGHTHTQYLTVDNPTGSGYVSINRKSGTTVASRSVAMGANTTASGFASMATGQDTTASGQSSHAEGEDTTASGSCSHAEGNNTEATNEAAHAEGGYTTASGQFSHAEGYSTTASNSESHSEGYDTTASGSCSHAEGNGTTASNSASHSEGYRTTASGQFSHAEGWYTVAIGKNSHAEGEGYYNSSLEPVNYSSTTPDNTIINDWYESQFSLAKGEASHVEGWNCLALGNYSHAEGVYTQARGYNCHTEGNDTIAVGDCAHAEGFYTIANAHQHAQGKYNTAKTGGAQTQTTGTAFIIGNGWHDSDSARSNAFRVDYNGNAYYGQGSSISAGADYAEYFEWQDSNPNTEDRRGYFVTLDGDKIKIAKSNDYILGIVSGQPAVIGNGDEDWRGRYILDEFGAFIIEEFEYEEEIHETVVDEETGEARIETKTIAKTGTRYKQNPDYDPSLPYIQRADRPEWSAVGMMGVLSVRDDGTCQVNGYCKVAEGGIATASDSGYRVMKRINDHIVQVVFR